MCHHRIFPQWLKKWHYEDGSLWATISILMTVEQLKQSREKLVQESHGKSKLCTLGRIVKKPYNQNKANFFCRSQFSIWPQQWGLKVEKSIPHCAQEGSDDKQIMVMGR